MTMIMIMASMFTIMMTITTLMMEMKEMLLVMTLMTLTALALPLLLLLLLLLRGQMDHTQFADVADSSVATATDVPHDETCAAAATGAASTADVCARTTTIFLSALALSGVCLVSV